MRTEGGTFTISVQDVCYWIHSVTHTILKAASTCYICENYLHLEEVSLPAIALSRQSLPQAFVWSVITLVKHMHAGPVPAAYHRRP